MAMIPPNAVKQCWEREDHQRYVYLMAHEQTGKLSFRLLYTGHYCVKAGGVNPMKYI